MPHDNNDLASKTGIDKQHKQPIDLYDAVNGRYDDPACAASEVANKPSKDTKKPFSGMTGGK